MAEITLKVTYREYLIIRHSLERYAERWRCDITELEKILGVEDVDPEIIERCKAEILEIDKIRIATQQTWLNVTNQATESCKKPKQNEYE